MSREVAPHAVSRRAALSMAAAIPVIPAMAATQLPVDRAAWDSAYHEYRRLKLRMDAYYTLGPMHWANEDHQYEKMNKESDPAALAAADTVLRAEEDAQEPYYRPVSVAALALMKIAAPDLDAVAAKMQVHKDIVDGLIEGERDTWDCIEADLRRLAL